MTSRRQVSRAGLELIKRFEGYRARAAELPDGRWVIGYSHTKSARRDAEVSQDDAEALLIYDLLPVTNAVREHVRVPLTQNQFDALCAFVFNVGVEPFLASSVLRRLNDGEPLQAAAGLEHWRRAAFEDQMVLIDALVRRRAIEKALFLTPEENFPFAPSAVLRPTPAEDGEAPAPEAAEEIVAGLSDGRIILLRATDPQHDPELAPFPYESEAPPAVTAEPEAETPPPQLDAPPIPSRGEDAEPMTAAAAEAADAGETLDRPGLDELRSMASPSLMWAGLALVGLVIFAVGIFWGFSPDAGRDGAIAPVAIGWGLGLVGIICVATAVYFLLDRLSGPEEEEEEEA